ncbi:MAG TPA: hypothetical protein VMF06_17445 [Candidatus Limnocylindria bacterium]|nr:hypothetical protein [Candidatus Limnocylindria bacterium]
MSWFGLDPQSIAARFAQAGPSARVPTLVESVVRGVLGFTAVSVAGFVPWAIGGRWLHRSVGEVGMYIACALVFIVLSGLLLHRLIIGPGSLSRFYKLFGIAFTAYSAAWIGIYIPLGGDAGGSYGLLAGTMVMGGLFSLAFGAPSAAAPSIAALFLFNCLGYFGGGWVEGVIGHNTALSIAGHTLSKANRMTLAMLSWGVCYGAGLGLGLSLSFYFCQAPARRLIRGEPVSPESAG